MVGAMLCRNFDVTHPGVPPAEELFRYDDARNHSSRYTAPVSTIAYCHDAERHYIGKIFRDLCPSSSQRGAAIDQSENREGARPHDSAVAATARGWGEVGSQPPVESRLNVRFLHPRQRLVAHVQHTAPNSGFAATRPFALATDALISRSVNHQCTGDGQKRKLAFRKPDAPLCNR